WDCNYATEGGQKGFNAHLAAAREAVERALSLEPDLPDALFARSMIQTNFDYNWKGAAETLRKALTLAPQDPALLMQAGNLAAARGEKAQSLEFDQRAVALDPVNAQARAFLASALPVPVKQEEARAEYARVGELNRSAPNAHADNATPVCPVCAQIRCYRIFTTTRAGMHSCARWAWPTTN